MISLIKTVDPSNPYDTTHVHFHVVDGNVGWPELVSTFHKFLLASGYVVTKESVIEELLEVAIEDNIKGFAKSQSSTS